MRTAAFLLAAFAALPAAAQTLVAALPGEAELRAEEAQADGAVTIALGPWRDGRMEALSADGAVLRRAWRSEWPGAATVTLARSLRDWVEGEGYTVLFSCETGACGGFDFRYALGGLAEPAMHVDLGDFAYLSARRGEGMEAEHLALLMSRSHDYGYVEVTHVGPPGEAAPETAKSTKSEPAAALPTGAGLDARAAMVLSDLRFASGSAELEAGRYESLARLAAWMADNPQARIALVGHTDSAGSLEINMDISARRAASVRARLLADYGIAPGRLEAHGIGYLSPVASNDDEAGRALNRRVEAVVVAR